MRYPRFEIHVGAVRLDSRVPATLNMVVGIEVELELNAPPNRLSVTLGAPSGKEGGIGSLPGSGLLGGDTPFGFGLGDPVEAMLGFGDESSLIFTGELGQIEPGVSQVTIRSTDSARRLTSLYLNQTFEQQTCGEIVSGLAAEAGVRVSQQEAGIELPLYAVDENRSGFDHVRDLAQLNGFDFYFDSEDGLIFEKPVTKSPRKTLRYGVDILRMESFRRPQAHPKIEVHGESPASSQGLESAHWLVKSFDNFLGTAGGGESVQSIRSPVIKTQEAANAVAEGALRRSIASSRGGRLRTLGANDVLLGDVVAIADHPDQTINGEYQVSAIRHLFSTTVGFVTDLTFRGLSDTATPSF